MAYCSKCGAELPAEAQYCPKCGTPTQVAAGQAPARPVSEKQEKHEKREKGEKMEKRGDRSGAFVGGGIVLWLGITFYLAQIGRILWSNWWGYFLLGMGVILILQAVSKASSPAYRSQAVGPLVGGVVLVAIGLAAIVGFGELWPLVLIGIGLAIIIGGITARRRSPAPP